MKKNLIRSARAVALLASIVFTGTSVSQARDYPVVSGEEFAAALPSLQPGDTLVFAQGVWRDVKLPFRARGTEDKPVTLRAEVPGKTVFEGASELIFAGDHLVVSGLKFQNNAQVTSIVTPYKVTVASVVTFTAAANHCRLTETAIVDSGEGVTTYLHFEPGNRFNRVDHCFFSNQGKIGVTCYVQAHPTQPNEHQIDHNYFGDRKPGTGNRWETIRLGHSEQQRFVSATTVAHNYFYRCNGENECISNKSTGNKFLHNALVETRGELTLRHGDRAWVEGNHFLGCNETAGQGVRVIGSDHVVINNYFKGVRDAVVVYSGEVDPEPRGYAPVVNALIAFNTIEDCVNPFVLGASGRPVPPKALRIAYNLVQARTGTIIKSQADGIDVNYDGNLMFGAETGIGDQPGILRQKPVLKTDSWGRIHPTVAESSETANSGKFPEARNDINGKPRTGPATAGAIGAESARPLYPLSRQEVGPLWMGRVEAR